MHKRHTSSAVIIGAGIVGAAAAFFLSRAGANVTVIEGEAPAAGATGASDGAVSVATKRPGPMMAVAQKARALYEVLSEDGTLNALYHLRPTFLIARSEMEMSFVSDHAQDLRQAGEKPRLLDRSALDLELPGLGRSVTGAAIVPGEGHAIGYEIATRFLALSRARVMRYRPVRSIRILRNRVSGVELEGETIAADTVIVAAGLGCRELLCLHDVIVPRKGQMIVTDRMVQSRPALPGHIISAAYLAAKRAIQIDKPHVGLVIDPLVTGQLLIGGTRESGSEDRRTDVEMVSTILREAIELYPAIENRRIIRTYSGIRTATRDGLPLIGPSPNVEGLVVATGFEGDGICLGPLMGSIAADLALGNAPKIDVSAFSPSRFQNAMEIA